MLLENLIGLFVPWKIKGVGNGNDYLRAIHVLKPVRFGKQ